MKSWRALSLAVAVLCGSAPVALADGFSPGQVTRLTQAVRGAMSRQGYPGLDVGIWEPGKSYVRAFGLADTVAARPMRIGDRFRVGSITKTFLGTLVLQLAGEGRLRLDETLDRFYPKLPAIPRGSQITIRELLNHTSLIPDIAPTTVQQLLHDPAMRFVPNQVIQTAVAQPYFQSPPLFHYSDVNYLILGRIAEIAGGRPLGELLRHRVLGRLGLRHTYFDPTTGILGAHAHGYALLGGVETDVTRWSTSYAWAAGAMVSNLHDLELWSRELVRGATLKRREQRERLQFIDTGQPYQYGLGIMRVGDFCGHNGLIFGYDSAMFYSAQSRTAIVILANQTPLLDSPPLKKPSDTANLAVVLLRIALASSPRHAATSSPC